MPVLFSTVAAVVNISLAENGRLLPEAMSPLTMDNLIFNLSYDNPLKGLVSSIDAVQFWSLALLTLAYRQWTSRSTLQSAVICVSPTLLIYGIWMGVSLS